MQIKTTSFSFLKDILGCWRSGTNKNLPKMMRQHETDDGQMKFVEHHDRLINGNRDTDIKARVNTKSLPWVLIWDRCSSPLSQPLRTWSFLDRNGAFSFWLEELGICYSQLESKNCDCHYAIRTFFFSYVKFWSYFPQKTKENQCSRTFLYHKGFCPWFLKRSNNSINGQMCPAGTSWKTWNL